MPAPVDTTFQQAIRAHKAGQLAEAERLYRTVLQARPDHADARHNLGVLAVSVDKPAQALPLLKAALQAVPTQAQYWVSYIDALIRAGQADVVLTGGSESMLCFGGIKAWEGLRVMSKDGCRPFCATRNGMVQGEGAAVFVFEERERAMARGAPILAEVAGFAMTSDAADIVMPSQIGAERAMRGALRDAGLAPEDVGYINAHGTGTTANDRTECAAVRQVFGAHADRLMISSTKSMHGHLIGGTGAVELIACLMALDEGVIAPTINWRERDPDCDLDVVPNEAREARMRAVMTNAFAFGGLNAVLVLTAPA